jgi:Fur family iron response transcriptional regulator
MDHTRSATRAVREPSQQRCIAAILRMSGLKPTKQRVELARRIVGVERHFTADDLHREVTADGLNMSVGTIYNSLRQFQVVGMIRELAFDGLKAIYDTDTSGHHHFHLVDEDSIIDIPAGTLVLQSLPPVPAGYEVSRVEVIVRLRRAENRGPA